MRCLRRGSLPVERDGELKTYSLGFRESELGYDEMVIFGTSSSGTKECIS